MMRKGFVLLMVLMTAALMFGCSSSDSDDAADVVITPEDGMDRAIRLEALKNHLAAFETIAADTAGDRSAGSEAETAARDYIRNILSETDLVFSEQEVLFRYFAETSVPSVSRTSPSAAELTPGEDVATMTFSGSGSVTGEPAFITPMIPPGSDPNDSTDGCEAEDFESVDLNGKIAVLQRGGCSYEEKAEMAEARGASAILIFNEGQIGRTEVITGTLGENASVSVPVAGLSYAAGAELYELVKSGSVTLRVTIDSIDEDRTGVNLIAETPDTDSSPVILAGAHLDSSAGSPGINANGSGAAALLEFAYQSETIGFEPVNRMRFAWWTAYEQGVLGSTQYAFSLSDDEAMQIAMYIDLDTIGSTNSVFGVLDGDLSATGDDAIFDPAFMPAGSDRIETAFTDYFASQNLSVHPLQPADPADYAPFMYLGIPVGGLSAGKGGIKTVSEADIFGGTAGEPYDPCFHTLCDNTDNIRDDTLIVNARAFAGVMQNFAESDTLLTETGTRRSVREVSKKLSAASKSGYDRFHGDRHLRSSE